MNNSDSIVSLRHTAQNEVLLVKQRNIYHLLIFIFIYYFFAPISHTK